MTPAPRTAQPVNPELRDDLSREHALSQLVMPFPLRFSVIASTSLPFLSAAGRVLLELRDKERVGQQ